MEVAVFFGGRSCEHDVSIITAVQCMANVDKEKYNVYPVYLKDGGMYTSEKLFDIDFYKNINIKKLTKIILEKGVFYKVYKNILIRCFKPDVVINCCHGGEGENGVIAGLLEYNRIPYTSAGVLESAVTMDKVATKQILEGLLVNVLPYIVVHRNDYKNNIDEILLHIETFLEYPIIIKPATLGSSIGVTYAKNREELENGIEVACNFSSKIIVEKALIDFCELNCAVMRQDEIIASEVEKPLTTHDILTFSDKYLNGRGMKNVCREMPANIEKDLYIEVQEMSKRLYYELDLHGIVRIDYLVSNENKLYVNEINSVPGSLAFYLFEGKMSYRKLIDNLIDGALKRDIDNKNNSLAYKSDILKTFNKMSNIKQLHK